jgi:D-Tyr-tRNAtyr deacylase
MIALLQRVLEASVTIQDGSLEDDSSKPTLTGAIGAGILALVAVETEMPGT